MYFLVDGGCVSGYLWRDKKRQRYGRYGETERFGVCFLAFGDASFNTALNILINNVLITVALTPVYRRIINVCTHRDETGGEQKVK